VRRTFIGAALVIAGIAAFIEAHGHRPRLARLTLRERRLSEIGVPFHAPMPGLSQTPYDVLRIGAWALVMLGALTVVLGLIAYRTQSARGAA
jgi:uncharacterized membrane protein HdeD (DUF308 family)